MTDKLRSYLFGAGNIAWMSLSAALMTAFMHGEIMDWSGMIEVLKDASLPAVIMTVAWLRMRSPQSDSEILALQKELDKLKRDQSKV